MPSDSEGPADNIRRTARQWRAIVEQVQQSQLTEGDFCRQYDLGRTTFGRWRRRFLSEDHNPGFVQIQLAGPAGTTLSNPWTIEVNLPGDMCLRIRGGQ